MRLYDKLALLKATEIQEGDFQLIIADDMLTNVVEYEKVNGKWGGRWREVQAIPPFNQFAIEVKNVVFLDSDIKYYIGFVEVIDVIECDQEMLGWWKHQTNVAKSRGIPCAFKNTRWLFICSYYMWVKNGDIYQGPAVSLIEADRDGRLLTSINKVPSKAVKDYEMSDENIRFVMERLQPIQRCVFETLDNLNCVNVSLKKVEPNFKKSRRHRKKYGQPLVAYHELVVPGTGINLSRSTVHGEKDVRRAHLVRGHMKRRSTGTYYWSPHVRGDRSVGIVEKRYKVKSPDQ